MMRVFTLAALLLFLPIAAAETQSDDDLIFGCDRTVFEATKITSSDFFDGSIPLVFGQCLKEQRGSRSGVIHGLLILDEQMTTKIDLVYFSSNSKYIFRRPTLKLVSPENRRQPITLAKIPAAFQAYLISDWLAAKGPAHSRQIAVMDDGFCGSYSLFVLNGRWQTAFFPGQWSADFFVAATPEPVAPARPQPPFFGCERAFFEETKIHNKDFFDVSVEAVFGLCRRVKSVYDIDYSAAHNSYDLLILDQTMTVELERVDLGDDWPAHWIPPSLYFYGPVDLQSFYDDGWAPEPRAPLSLGLAKKNITRSGKVVSIPSVHCFEGGQGREDRFFVHEGQWWEEFSDW